MVVYDTLVEKLENTREFDTSIVNAMVEDFQDTNIMAVSGKLPISGLQTLRTWETKDTRSGRLICGVVRMWSLPSAIAAKDMGRQMRSPAARPQGAKSQNSGYKIESTQSEDF